MARMFVFKINDFVDDISSENITTLKYIAFIPIINIIFIIIMVITYFKNLNKYDK